MPKAGNRDRTLKLLKDFGVVIHRFMADKEVANGWFEVIENIDSYDTKEKEYWLDKERGFLDEFMWFSFRRAKNEDTKMKLRVLGKELASRLIYKSDSVEDRFNVGEGHTLPLIKKIANLVA